MIYVDEICLGNHENNEENKHDMFQGGAHCSLTTGPTTSKNPSQAKKNLSPEESLWMGNSTVKGPSRGKAGTLTQVQTEIVLDCQLS